MGEVGAGCPSAAPERDYALGHSKIQSDCEKWLLDIEHDLGSRVCTFEAVRWALSELVRMERHPDPSADDGVVEDEAEDKEPGERGSTGGKTPEKLPTTRLEPSVIGLGSKDAVPAVTNKTGLNSAVVGDEKPIESDNKDANLSGLQLLAEEPANVDLNNWKRTLEAGCGGKRKIDEDASGNDGEKRARVSESPSRSRVEEAVIEADRGEAGMRLAERINSRLAIPGCIFLTNLVSHCLLVSMDQAPTETIQDAVLGLNSRGAVDSSDENVSNSLPGVGYACNSSDCGEWMWLQSWLVRTVLSDAEMEGRFASLDWLIALMTATRQSLIKPILVDLASDLVRRETEGSPTLASYLRRTGVLEYAALRDPERVAGSLLSLFPPEVFPCPDRRGDGVGIREGETTFWQGWLGLMVLCPKLFSAFSRLWVPTLSVELVQSWTVESAAAHLPAIWSILLDSCREEPGTSREWLFAALVRRLPELAPVASSFVCLLGGLYGSVSDDGTNERVCGFGKSLLTVVYKELSKHVLPKGLGSGQNFSRDLQPDIDKLGDSSGIHFFMENLKQHSHVLWRKALENCSSSKCTCCDASLNKEAQLELFGKTEAGNDVSTHIESSDVHPRHERGGNVQRGCMYKDPLIQLCHITLLCCTEHTVADLLANDTLLRPFSSGSFETESHRRLLMVMRVMRIVSGQGRGTLILELWAQHMTHHTTVASDGQALWRVLALRQLLDPTFWEKSHALGSSPHFALVGPAAVSENATGYQGLSWSVVWKGLYRALDAQWLRVLLLMHRDGAWELKLVVLGVLQLLTSDGSTRPQLVADRLKGVLGLFFSWLEMPDGRDYRYANGKLGTTATTLDPRWRWQRARAMELLKAMIIELASSSFPSFTLMVNSLLDFSFEHSMQISAMPSASSANPLSRTEVSAFPSRRVGSASRSGFCVAPLISCKLDRYGKLVLISAAPSEFKSSTGGPQDMQLMEKNCRFQSGAMTSLQLGQKDRVTGVYHKKRSLEENIATPMPTPDIIKKDFVRRKKVFEAELGSLLRRTLYRAKAKSADHLDVWPCQPASVLATHMADRLETPHEISMEMKQYAEVLPKHISSLRHIFLSDCFSQNPLLMEMVELVIKHGDNKDVELCVEFVQVLLADNVFQWHSAFRTRDAPSLPKAKVDDEEVLDRMQVNRLIQLIATANWLPQPLAASGEIVAIIDGADVADLLLLVWRCMQHAMAPGNKGRAGSSSKLFTAGVSVDGQSISTGSRADEEVRTEGTYTEWESHFFAILRRNVSQIGPHFAQVYPIRTAF